MINIFKNNFPLFKAVFGSFSLFFNNLKSYFILGSVFSLILIIISLISGQSSICEASYFKDSIICFRNLLIQIIATLFLFFVVSVYIRNWFQTVLLKRQNFSVKSLMPNKYDIKILLVLLVFILCLCIAAISGFLLFIREANPDWKIELIYFSVVSLGFFAPVFSIPLLSYVSFVAEGDKIPNIKKLLQVSKGKYALMFISFVSIQMLSFLVTSTILRYFFYVADVKNVLVLLTKDFLQNILLMFNISIYVNFCYVEKKFLFERS